MHNENVTIKELDNNNWYECCKLELEEKQKEYMESNAISIAQTKFEPTLRSYAIYSEDNVVGFAMFNSVKEELDSYWIYRIMIDKEYQRKGIGKYATKLLIEQMAKLPDCQSIAVGYHLQNQGAHKLYSEIGFKDKGDRFGKEMAVILELKNI